MGAPWAAGARVRIVGKLHGQDTNNVIHLATNTQGWDDPTFFRQQLILLMEAIRDCVVDTLLPAVTSDWTFVRVEGHLIVPFISDVIVVTGTPDNVGELSAVSTSFQSALVNVRSGVGGRRGRGRMFLPPPGEAQIANSDIDGPTLVLLAAFLACVASKFMGANPTTIWRLGVLSRTDAGPTNANFDVGFRECQSLNPVARVAIMSSRKVGSGS